MPFLLPFQQSLCEQVGLAVSEIESGGNSKGILLIGDSGVGKSFAIDSVVSMYAPDYSKDQPVTPVIRIDARATPDIRSIASAALLQLGRPVKPKAKPAELEDMLHAALRAHRTLVFILEEFHNSLTKEMLQLRGKNQEFLKNLWNFNPRQTGNDWASTLPGRDGQKIVILVSGIKELLNVFQSGTELGSRFGTVVTASHLSLLPEEFKQFRTLIREFAARFNLSDVVSPNDTRLAARIYFATQAHLRDMERLFERVRTLKRIEDDPNVFALFEKAFATVSSEREKVFNPFDADDNEIAQLTKKTLSKTKPSK